MPTYDYQCSSCGHEFELFQSITAKPIKKCPECGRNTAKRLIGTGAGIVFKGSGFYQTDYRSASYQKAAKADADSGTKGQKDKTESKSGTTATEKNNTSADATKKKTA